MSQSRVDEDLRDPEDHLAGVLSKKANNDDDFDDVQEFNDVDEPNGLGVPLSMDPRLSDMILGNDRNSLTPSPPATQGRTKRQSNMARASSPPPPSSSSSNGAPQQNITATTSNTNVIDASITAMQQPTHTENIDSSSTSTAVEHSSIAIVSNTNVTDTTNSSKDASDTRPQQLDTPKSDDTTSTSTSSSVASSSATNTASTPSKQLVPVNRFRDHGNEPIGTGRKYLNEGAMRRNKITCMLILFSLLYLSPLSLSHIYLSPLPDTEHPNWAKHHKHVFVLSSAGKPIYSRYGDEQNLTPFMASLTAIVSFVADLNDVIR
jgi:hypothetical protein